MTIAFNSGLSVEVRGYGPYQSSIHVSHAQQLNHVKTIGFRLKPI